MENSEYVKHLKALQNIRDICGGYTLNLPQMCVVGDQSSGKSSLLKLITGVDFPVNSGTCTKAAIVVECKHGDEQYYGIQSMETKQYEECCYDDMASNILRVQSNLLYNSTSCSKISDVEIKVKVIGPEMVDIIVVDLPGIINVGEGANETRQLIRQYIKPQETLILLVSEAKQDKELITAVELASEFDPEGERTMHIYTKFDTFDTQEAKLRAVDWVCDEQAKALGGHAVVAAPGGRDYDSKEAEEYLGDTGLPCDRFGIDTLKERLPTIFSSLIATNLPGLKATIEAKAKSAKAELQKVGEKPTDGMLMIKHCQDFLLKKQSIIQNLLTPHMQKFQHDIRSCEEGITEEWTSSKFPPNVFVCAFFSGNDAFRECLLEITEWWKPILEEYTAEVEKAVIEFIELLNPAQIGVSLSLRRSISCTWKAFFPDLLCQFKSDGYRELGKFEDFGTVNHYLTSKYQAEMVLPNGVVTEFIQSLTLDDFVEEPDTCEPPSTISLKKTKISLKEKLERIRNSYDDRFTKMSLHQQQERRLHAAVVAAFSVEEKTFTDLIFKLTNDLLGKVQDWIMNCLMTHQDIKDAAVEDKETTRRRERLHDTLNKMNNCLREINQIM